MASAPGVKTPPSCFCFKSAIEVHTDTGLVYECHYTNLDLWLEHRSHHGTESNHPSAKLSTAASPRSSPGSVLNSSWDHHHVTDALVATTTPYKRPAPSLSRPAHGSQMIVCGFHMHASLWERFKCIVKDDELTLHYIHRRLANTVGKQDAFLARQHHRLVLRHPDFHNQLLVEADKWPCSTETYKRWVNDGKKVVGAKTSPAGGAPICYCGTRMNLSSSHHNEMLSVKYFCAGRLVDAKGGCSRVREADKWVRLQELVPVHPLLPTQTAPAAAAETDSELEDTDSDVEEHSSSAATTTIRTSSHHENGLWRDQQRLDGSAGWDTDLEPETESDQSTSPERESRHDPDELWDRYCNLGKSTMGLQFLPLPAGLTLVKDQVERIGEARGFNTEEFEETSRTKPYQARYFNADKYRQEIAATTGGGDHHRYGYDRHAGTSSEQQHSRMSRDTNSGPKMNERLAEFRSRLHELYSMSPDAPAGSKISETLKELEARLSRWRESRGRLHEHKKELCEDGLDNPALRCRCCNEGLLTRANVPCYHLVMCDECIHKHGRCVICNTAIESTRRTYWG